MSAMKLISGIFILLSVCIACKNDGPIRSETAEAYSKSAYGARNLNAAFKKYWFSGEAEITSYQLKQPRYGEMRDGKAVLVFVKEDFLPNEQVKANGQTDKNVAVLKLNKTTNFITGIYPYSIMSSIFYPLEQKSHAIKVSNSVQEWCGQQYMQLNNRGNFEINLHSYFEGEADKNFALQKEILEDELWAQLRVDPDSLPTGNHLVIPSLEFTRLKHAELKAYNAQLSKTDSTYTIAYTNLDRKLVIKYESEFPYVITGWQESYLSGSGPDAQMLTAEAIRLKTLKTQYWKQNAKKFKYLRDSLDL
jgi:hypothetical protein